MEGHILSCTEQRVQRVKEDYSSSPTEGGGLVDLAGSREGEGSRLADMVDEVEDGVDVHTEDASLAGVGLGKAPSGSNVVLEDTHTKHQRNYSEYTRLGRSMKLDGAFQFLFHIPTFV